MQESKIYSRPRLCFSKYNSLTNKNLNENPNSIISIIAIILMKRDKQYAKEEKWRIRESTLLVVALAGGALGMYYAMYKYKHKTLHKKFTICVPLFIVLHFAFISYAVISSFII